MNASTESLDRVQSLVLSLTAGTHFVPLRRSDRSWLVRTMLSVMVLSLATVAVLLSFNRTAAQNIVFTQVQEQVGQAKTVQYVEYLPPAKIRTALDELRERDRKIDEESAALKQKLQDDPELVKQLFEALGDPEPSLEKLEQLGAKAKDATRQRIQFLEKCLAEDVAVPVRRVWVSGRFLMRTEEDSEAGHTVAVLNMETGEGILCNSVSKVCNRTKVHVSIDNSSTTPLPQAQVDLYQGLSSVPVASVESLPEKSINGKAAAGFVYRRTQEKITTEVHYWIDQASRLPVRMESYLVENDQPTLQSIAADFVFNEPLDPGLFSLTPPEGYRVHTGHFGESTPGK